MKKIKYIPILFFILSAGIFFTSCEADEGAVYHQEGTKVSFQLGTLFKSLTTDDGNTISIGMTRSNTTGDLDVPITLTGGGQVFNLTSPSIHFGSGEGTAYAVINHPGAGGLDPAGAYELKLSVDSALLSPSGIALVEISVQRKLTWQKIENTGLYNSAVFGGVFDAEYEKAAEASNVFRIVGFFENPIIITIDKAAGTATIPDQDLGEDLFGEDTNSWISGTAGTFSNGECFFGGGTWANAIYTSPPPYSSGLRMTNELFVLPEGSY